MVSLAVVSLGEQQLIAFLVALTLVVALARVGGELARRAGQPEVLGELVAGVLLGPSVLGLAWPAGQHFLFGGREAGFALSAMSTIGALLVLLLAGREVDLPLLREQLRPGTLAAGFAIVPSFLAGAAVGRETLGLSTRGAAFLGIVLSVSAISVAAKLLIEAEATRREFAQVILAGGIATELAAWVFVAVASASRHGSPYVAAGQTLAIAVGFFVVTVALGRAVVYRAMRLAADRAVVRGGPLSLVLVLTLGFSAATQALGLHALLGAFVFGVLLSRAPRANERLGDRLNALTVSLFAPVFFTLAGAQVDLRRLASASALAQVGMVLVVATIVKIGFVSLGTRIGGFRGARALLVGVGLNAKGGTDVVVAILGHQLGLLSSTAYTDYTVVAIVTVLFTPLAMQWLQGRSPPSTVESDRLAKEEAAGRAYSSGIERVLVPVVEALRPNLAVDILEQLALSEDRPGRLLDVTQLRPDAHDRPLGSGQEALEESVAASVALQSGDRVELFSAQLGQGDDLVEGIVTAAGRHDLLAIGASPTPADTLFGPLADAVVHRAPTDVLVVVQAERRHLPWSSVHRILVPTNGLPHAEAAADLAGFLAQQSGAELVLLHVGPPTGGGPGRWRRRYEPPTSSGAHLEGLTAALGRFSVKVERRNRVGLDAAAEILEEISAGGQDLVIMGALDRGREDEPYLGPTIEAVLGAAGVPVVVLVSGRRQHRLVA